MYRMVSFPYEMKNYQTTTIRLLSDIESSGVQADLY